MEARALASEDQDAVAGEVELVVIGVAALVEADDPDVLPLQVFKGADEVDDTGDAKVFDCTGAGFDSNGAEGGGAALGKDDAIHACAVGYAEERAEVLRVFNAIKGEEEARCAGGGGLEEVFDGEDFLGADHGDHTLVAFGLGHHRQLLAGLLTDADASLAAEIDEALKAIVLPFASHQNVVKAALACLEGFFDRMQAIENFHEG
jgi:hypothetical protein